MNLHYSWSPKLRILAANYVAYCGHTRNDNDLYILVGLLLVAPKNDLNGEHVSDYGTYLTGSELTTFFRILDEAEKEEKIENSN